MSESESCGCNEDSSKLLKECIAGTKMAVESIDEIIEKVENSNLKKILADSKSKHEKLEEEIHKQLNSCGCADKEPNPMAKGMSWMKSNMKMTMDNSDETVADLITDGCNIGIKSLYRYSNKYKNANEKSKKICYDLIEVEETLRKDIKEYL